MDLKYFIKTLNDKWWGRIFLFAVILYPFYHFVFLNLLFVDFSYGIMSYLILLTFTTALSIFIEKFRANSKWFLIGIFWDSSTNKNMKFLFVLLTATFLFIIIFMLILGAEIRLFKYFDISWLAFIILNLLLLAAIEEITFRGIVFQSLLQTYGLITSSVVISLLFMIVHLPNFGSTFLSGLNIFLFSLATCFIFYISKSLIIATLYHYLWNIYQVLFLGWNVSGFSYYYGFINLKKNNLPDIITGGNFGIEGSVLLTFILLLHMYLIFKYIKISPSINAKLFVRDYSKNPSNNLKVL